MANDDTSEGNGSAAIAISNNFGAIEGEDAFVDQGTILQNDTSLGQKNLETNTTGRVLQQTDTLPITYSLIGVG